MSRNSSSAIGLLLLGVAGFGSCSYSPDSYSCFSAIDPAEGWAYGDSFVYMPEIQDSLCNGRLSLLVRHTNDYPFANLWVEVKSQQPDSNGLKIVTDTFCITLADIYGNWQGRGSGATIERLDTLYADFPLISGAPLRLRHVMRPERVEGIETVGFIFEPNSLK